MATLKILQISLFPMYKLFFTVHTSIGVRASYNAKKGNILIIANHIHSIDPFIIVGHLRFREFIKLAPIRTMTANKFLYGKWYGIIARAVGCYPAQPYKNEIYGLKATRKYAENSSILIFPEGARSTVHDIERLKTGASVIANETNLPVLPVYIERVRKSEFKSFEITSGKQFYTKGMSVEKMMDKVWELKNS